MEILNSVMDRAYDRTAERLIEMLKQENSRHINDDELHSHLNDRLSSSGDANSTNVNVNNGTVLFRDCTLTL